MTYFVTNEWKDYGRKGDVIYTVVYGSTVRFSNKNVCWFSFLMLWLWKSLLSFSSFFVIRENNNYLLANGIHVVLIIMCIYMYMYIYCILGNFRCYIFHACRCV